MLNKDAAQAVLAAAHAAWSKGDVEAMLQWYADDLVYYCNTGGMDGGALTVTGKDGMRSFLLPVVEVADSMSVIERFSFDGRTGRAKISCYIRHRSSGHVLAANYRQIVTYQRNRIVHLEEIHDAARMQAFWRLVTEEVRAQPVPVR